ncbi:uncharacterized protein LOC144637191 [Oculina patagonica]
MGCGASKAHSPDTDCIVRKQSPSKLKCLKKKTISPPVARTNRAAEFRKKAVEAKLKGHGQTSPKKNGKMPQGSSNAKPKTSIKPKVQLMARTTSKDIKDLSTAPPSMNHKDLSTAQSCMVDDIMKEFNDQPPMVEEIKNDSTEKPPMVAEIKNDSTDQPPMVAEIKNDSTDQPPMVADIKKDSTDQPPMVADIKKYH